MHSFRRTLSHSEQRLFDITFKARILNHCSDAELDGMEMKSIVAALTYKANKLLNQGEVQQYIHYKCLAGKIFTSLKMFQQTNGPEVNTNLTA